MDYEELKIRLAPLYLYRRRDLTQDLTHAIQTHRVIRFSELANEVLYAQAQSVHLAHQVIFQKLKHLSCAVLPTEQSPYVEPDGLTFSIQTFTRVHDRLYGYHENKTGIRFSLGQWVNDRFETTLYHFSEADREIPIPVAHAAKHVTLAVKYRDVDYTTGEYVLIMIQSFVKHVTGQSYSDWLAQHPHGLRLLTQTWFQEELNPILPHHDILASQHPKERLFLCFTLTYVLNMNYTGDVLWRVINNLLAVLTPEIEYCERQLFGQTIL